jgi:SAM-dependent methyltransferase
MIRHVESSDRRVGNPEVPEIERSREIDEYLAGSKLYGDGLPAEEAEAWRRDEKEAYYNLGSRDRSNYIYSYHALNWYHGFSRLQIKNFKHILGVGSAYGEELLPVGKHAREITILEACSGFVVPDLDGIPLKYVEALPSGAFPFADESFDLLTCFSALHHMPNVSDVLREFYRCLMPGGFVLLREPIISMGDWRKPRRGVTRHERGIPLSFFRTIIREAGFEILRERKCTYSLTSRFRYVMRSPVYNSRWCVAFDAFLCRLPIWSNRYHPRHFWHKLRPWSVAFVLRKPLETDTLNENGSGNGPEG